MRKRVIKNTEYLPPTWTNTDRKAVIVALSISLLLTIAVISVGVYSRSITAPPSTPAQAVPPPSAPQAQPQTEPPPELEGAAPEAHTIQPVLAVATEPKPGPATGPLTITITDKVLLPNVARFGLNINARTTYGAAQHLKNLLPNPGFESGFFSSMIHAAKGATPGRVPQAFWDTDWTRDAGTSRYHTG